jgi:CO dehydrogenase maturation factor
MEAGVEHLGRGTTRGIDIMLIVVEPGARSIETAGRIVELARQIDIQKFGAVINKARQDLSDIEDKLKGYGLEVTGIIPYDTALVQADLESVAPIDKGGEAVEAIKDIWKKVSELKG